MKKVYEKPEMNFEEVRSDKAVANTCWGGAGTSMSWFYDTDGAGYVSFQIGSGNCSLNLTNVTYHYKDQNGQMTSAPLPENDPKYTEMYNALTNSGGSSGNPFKGEGAAFPVEPDPTWS